MQDSFSDEPTLKSPKALGPEQPLTPRFSVSAFLEITNQTLDYALANIEIEGEVSSFKVSKGKWVFFDLKDREGVIPCFMTIFQLRTTIRDGMRVVIAGTPRLSNSGRFSFSATRIQPIGEGSIKKSFELLKEKLSRQGLFDEKKKRPIPKNLKTVGVISSVTAAGYIDFTKILNERWGGLELTVANCGVQGLQAADEIIRAIDFFNERGDVDIIVIVRGGGSAEDLAVFNDELLTRKIASSRIPILTGIGHEIDETLADLAADVRASTPTNAAELLTKDRNAELWRIYDNLAALNKYLIQYYDTLKETISSKLKSANQQITQKIDFTVSEITHKTKLLASLNPEKILKQGYSIISGKISPGNVVKITTIDNIIKAEIKDVSPRNP